MRIGIIGRGRVGSAVAQGWKTAGHDVQQIGRDADTPPTELAAWADIVVLSVPWAAVEEVAGAISPAVGKVVIDCTNPIAMNPDGMGLALGHTTSAGERLQALLPGARVVKTLNQVGAEIMADATGFACPPVQLMAGNDDDAKHLVAGLLSDLGFAALDAGDLTKARLLEPFALVWINQAIARGKGRNWAFGAMERPG